MNDTDIDILYTFVENCKKKWLMLKVIYLYLDNIVLFIFSSGLIWIYPARCSTRIYKIPDTYSWDIILNLKKSEKTFLLMAVYIFVFLGKQATRSIFHVFKMNDM